MIVAWLRFAVCLARGHRWHNPTEWENYRVCRRCGQDGWLLGND